MLPMVGFMVLPIGLFLDRIFSQNRKVLKGVFIVLLMASFGVQLVGSSVSYQTIQMPAERLYGAQEARLKLTMDPNWSLLWKNTLILSKYGPRNFMFYNYLIKGTMPVWVIVALCLLVFTLLASGYLLCLPLLPPVEKQERKKLDRNKRKKRKRN